MKMNNIIRLIALLAVAYANSTGFADNPAPSSNRNDKAMAVINAYWMDYQQWEGPTNRQALFQCLADHLNRQNQDGTRIVTDKDVLNFLGTPDYFRHCTNATMTVYPNGPDVTADITEYVYFYTSPRYGPYAKFVTLTNGTLYSIGENTRTANDLTNYLKWNSDK